MITFGPAGLGPVKTAEKVLEEYHKKGIKSCEISFTYSVYIKKDEAKTIGKKAKELGIELSIHAPYFINLNSEDKTKIQASKQRILKCCERGEALGAKRVVFHPGFYGKNREGAYEVIKKNVQEMMDVLKANKWKIKLAPEVMGKVNVFGSPEEISNLAKDTKCDFCIDFAHILAREKKVDYDKIKKLFPQKEWHCHFSGIEYGEKGERKHIPVPRNGWKNLLDNLPKNKKINIICESPKVVEDTLKGIKAYQN